MPVLIVLILSVLLGGCAPTKIVSTPDTVAIRYDPLLSSSGAAFDLAQEHCGQYGRRAVPASPPSGSTPLSPRYASFLCVAD